MTDAHLDNALAEEFAADAALIHTLKTSNPHFRKLMERNHDLWQRIQAMQTGQAPASDEARHDLEKQRLQLLVEIAGLVAAAKV
jgi:uncharacterized protein YdcH (DUF465 family)